MNEQEWLASEDPAAMLRFMTLDQASTGWRHVSDRKLRLFACAACRMLWEHLDPQSRRAIEMAEKYADAKVAYHEVASITDHLETIARCLHPGGAVHNATAVLGSAEMCNTAIL